MGKLKTQRDAARARVVELLDENRSLHQLVATLRMGAKVKDAVSAQALGALSTKLADQAESQEGLRKEVARLQALLHKRSRYDGPLDRLRRELAQLDQGQSEPSPDGDQVGKGQL